MIAYISGKVAHREPNVVVIDCNGVGYAIKISLNTYTQLQGMEQAKLHTHFQVKEDGQTLYGFLDTQEKALFELLISVSGVGGNTALTILSHTSVKELATSIMNKNILQLKAVKGIGPKTAERIVLELKDKMSEFLSLEEKAKGSAAMETPILGNDAHKKQEALLGLTALGFDKKTMEARVNDILKKTGGNISVEDLIRQALKNG